MRLGVPADHGLGDLLAQRRKSAYDAVRVVLTHGATSSDATAVQQLVAKLAEQHGMDFVRDVAVELVAELAEVSSAVISSEDH